MRSWLPIITLTFALSALPLEGAVPKLSPEELQNKAAVIVVGKVQAVYSKRHRSTTRETTSSVAEITVQSVEKGSGLTEGDVVYAHFWRSKWIGKGRPDPGASGHTGVTEDQVVRVHLTRKNGTLRVLLPNGFQRLDDRNIDGALTGDTAALEQVQGKWKRVVQTEDGSYTILKEHAGKKTTVTVLNPDGKVLSAKDSEFRLENTGKVRIFTFFNNVVTAGPQKGQTDDTPSSYIYRVVGDDFIEVHGMLLDTDDEAIAFKWERIRDEVSGRLND